MYKETRNVEGTALFVAMTEAQRGGRMKAQDSTTQAKNMYKTAGQTSKDYLFKQCCFKCSSVLQCKKSLRLLLYYYFFMHNS